MLDEFIKSNRDEIITRARSKVAGRPAPRPTEHELTNGVPVFLDQLVECLCNAAPSNGELRNQLNSALMAFDILEKGTVGVGAVLGRSIGRLRETIDRALAEVRLESGVTTRERIRVSELIDEVEVGATFEANMAGLALKGCVFTIELPRADPLVQSLRLRRLPPARGALARMGRECVRDADRSLITVRGGRALASIARARCLHRRTAQPKDPSVGVVGQLGKRQVEAGVEAGLPSQDS
jgi:hypothetical protein